MLENLVDIGSPDVIKRWMYYLDIEEPNWDKILNMASRSGYVDILDWLATMGKYPKYNSYHHRKTTLWLYQHNRL